MFLGRLTVRDPAASCRVRSGAFVRTSPVDERRLGRADGTPGGKIVELVPAVGIGQRRPDASHLGRAITRMLARRVDGHHHSPARVHE